MLNRLSIVSGWLQAADAIKLASFVFIASVSTAAIGAGPIPGQGTWETTLLPRDGNKDGVVDAFYDTALGITWLRNANVIGLNRIGDATSWVSQLSFGGYDNWRLPNCQAFNPSTPSVCNSEMSHLWHVTLGNNESDFRFGPPLVSALKNAGGFQNLMDDGYSYWQGTANAVNPEQYWYFAMYSGGQAVTSGNSFLYAMAVADGDVFAVPELSKFAMLLAGLSLVGFTLSRKQRTTSELP